MTLRHWISLAVLGSLAACATQRASEGGTGTSTDWVRHCRLDDDCHGSLVCGCGLCTKPCKSDTACKPLDDQAVCVSAPIQCEVQASYCAPKADYTFPGAATEEPSANEVQSSQVSAALVQSDAGTGSDQSGAAWRVIEVPALGNEPRVVHTPDGWLALSNRTLGDGKAPSGYDAALYQSADGVHWTRLKLSFVTNDVQVEGLAYGNGTYVIGARAGGKTSFYVSSDLVDWQLAVGDIDQTAIGGAITFVGERFIAYGFNNIGVSADGHSFSWVPTTNVQPFGVAYGNQRYVLVGSGTVEVSDDGDNWRAVEIPCDLPGECITDPSGNVHQAIMGTVVFSDGAFYAAELRSTDGETWEAAGTPNSAPEGVAAGWLLSGTGTGEVGMQAWQPGDEPREVLLLRPSEFAQTAEGRPGTSIGVLDYEEDPPASVDVSFEDGADCVNSACVLIGSRLLLAPAPGTPPLPDHIARDANGNPLLSYDCPRSTQIHCDDYETRTGCVCDPEAPSIPEACPDVSNFECPAQFTTRDSEFELDEVGPANCDCNFVDPNQPASFAEHCDDSSEVCSELFTCLDYSPPSFGPPPTPERICSRGCSTDADCPSWTATGYCGGKAQSPCVGGVCGPRPCTSNP